ncbi:MAG: anthrone oxygenase family protein [Pseudomonadota bacterium]|nr:anthrone oxygenase family protein [Pseudomonadota bacterium]
MNSLTLSILITAALGSGMMAGLFCSFSSFVMKALSETPPPMGITAMQSINKVIVRPAFLVVFLGTGVACALVVGLGWQQLGNHALAWATVGGVVYVLGSIVVTIVFNVPLNNRLAAVDPESDEGAKMWGIYLVRWIRWNHVRSIATIASTLLLILAVLRASGRA